MGKVMLTTDPNTLDLDLEGRSNGFLSLVKQFETGKPNELGLMCRYDQNKFSPDLFVPLEVLRPRQLKNAIAKRQSEYLAGRSLAQSGLGLMGCSQTNIPKGQGGAPQWPEGVSGSISHSKGTCICLLYPSSQALVGVDIETVGKDRAITAILRMVFTPLERRLADTQSMFDKATFATLLFSAKETLYKLLFPVVGEYFGFPSAEMRALPNSSVLRLYLTRDLHPTLPKGAFFDLNYKIYEDQVVTWSILREGIGKDTHKHCVAKISAME
ncbi:MAG: 4'-phosphopantetheinyl transferase superfamily protein [Paracoccaceae bacterium]